MQSTTRWCLNEGSMSSCTYDRMEVVPDRPSRFTGHFSVSVAQRREWDHIVRVAGKGLARNPLLALMRLIAFRPIWSNVSQQSWRE